MNQPQNHKLVVALSGRGRTLENLLECSEKYGYEIAGVVSSNPTCRGAEIAKEIEVPLFVGDFDKDKTIKTKLYKWLIEIDPALIVLGGFVKVWPMDKAWAKKIINIHPALLPKFGGKGMYGHHVHKAVISSKDSVSGATVHFVDKDYDTGDIIAQVKVDVGSADAQTLADRVFQYECYLYPRVIEGLLNGKLPTKDGQHLVYDFSSSE